MAGPDLRSFRLVAEENLLPFVEQLLLAEGFRFKNEPFSPVCKQFEFTPFSPGSSLAAFFGYIYIQDRSSMLPPLALAPAEKSAVLDMCASPGGKSGFLAQLTGKNGFVLANEPNSARLANLRANLQRVNLLQCSTSAYAGEKLPLAAQTWDYILLDPPCSGWGTVKKNPRAIRMWQGSKTQPLIALQRQLLKKAEELLAPGGLLLYSTCTTNPAEDEEQTAFAVNELGLVPVPLAPFPGFVFDDRAHDSNALLIDSSASNAQGFYLSLLKKSGLRLKEQILPENKFSALPCENLDSEVFDASRLPEGSCTIFGDKVRFLPRLSANLPDGLHWQGPLLGRWQEKKRKFTPAPHLRVTIPESSPAAIVMDDVQAVQKFLRGQSLITNIKTSLAALWWRQLPLGIIPVKSGRAITAFQ